MREVHGVSPEEDVVCAGEDVSGDAHAAGDVGGGGEVFHAAEDDFPGELEEFAFVHCVDDAFLCCALAIRCNAMVMSRWPLCTHLHVGLGFLNGQRVSHTCDVAREGNEGTKET